MTEHTTGFDQSGRPAAPAQGNKKALIALIMAIVSFFLFPFILSIAALVIGYQAKKDVASSGGEQQAKWALILGWISLVWGVIAVGLYMTVLN